MNPGKLNIVIDGQWGSTGKGKLAAFLAAKYRVHLSVCNFAPNAGHTCYTPEGEKIVLQQLPSGLVHKDAQLAIGPTAVISLPILLKEIERHGVGERLWIDPLAVVIEDVDLATEEDLERISSTKKGCGSALSRKVLRKARVADEFEVLRPYLHEVVPEVQHHLQHGALVLAESAQGYDLSLNHGHRYPFTTSRDVTTGVLCSDFGVPPQLVGCVYGSLRPYPIRVGNVINEEGKQIGWSGPHHEDQREMTWREIEALSGGEEGSLIEKTTVTGKVRRVFSWSEHQFRRFVRHCGPTHLYIGFMDQIDYRNAGAKRLADLTRETRGFVFDVMRSALKATISAPPMVAYLGTGPKHDQMVDISKEGETA